VKKMSRNKKKSRISLLRWILRWKGRLKRRLLRRRP
jgi:hypothetical protein